MFNEAVFDVLWAALKSVLLVIVLATGAWFAEGPSNLRISEPVLLSDQHLTEDVNRAFGLGCSPAAIELAALEELLAEARAQLREPQEIHLR